MSEKIVRIVEKQEVSSKEKPVVSSSDPGTTTGKSVHHEFPIGRTVATAYGYKKPQQTIGTVIETIQQAGASTTVL